MCYPSPGPRCSSHATETLETTRTDLASATLTRQMMESADGHDPRERGYRAAVSREKLAQRRYDAALTAWKSTPKGLSSLADTYRQAVQRGDIQAANTAKDEWKQAHARRKQALYDMERVQALVKKDQELNVFVRSLPEEEKTSLGSTYSNGITGEVGVVLYSPTPEQESQWRNRLDAAGLTEAKVESLHARGNRDILDTDPDLRRKERLEEDNGDINISL